MVKAIITSAILAILVLNTSYAYSHSGGTNASGCHSDHQSGGSHCHNDGKPTEWKGILFSLMATGLLFWKALSTGTNNSTHSPRKRLVKPNSNEGQVHQIAVTRPTNISSHQLAKVSSAEVSDVWWGVFAKNRHVVAVFRTIPNPQKGRRVIFYDFDAQEVLIIPHSQWTLPNYIPQKSIENTDDVTRLKNFRLEVIKHYLIAKELASIGLLQSKGAVSVCVDRQGQVSVKTSTY